MSDADALRDFARFLEAANTFGPQVDPLIGLLPQNEAYVARVCAIPHEFNVPTICAAIPDVPAPTIEKTVEKIATSATVTPTASGFLMHDSVRRRVFGTWLDKPEFSSISRRLSEYYAHRTVIETNGRQAVLERRRVFHLVGADHGQGLDAVIRLCSSARERFEFSNCSSMLGLAHEYDSVLASSEQTALRYEEAKVAADLANWNRATQLLLGIINDRGASDEIRVRALNRLGLVEDAQHHREEALGRFSSALELATQRSIWNEIPSVSINMANVLRDLGRIDDALRHLNAAIEKAEELQDDDSVAAARNAEGLIHYRRGEYESAIRDLGDVADILFRRGRMVPLAAVQANLGLAYAGALRWVDSEAAFRQSLEVYRGFGASEPYARTLGGLARTVYAQQRVEESLQIAAMAEKVFLDTARPLEAGTIARDSARWLVAAGRPDNARQRYAVAIEYFRAAEASNEITVTERELTAVGSEKLPRWVRICLWGVGIVFLLVVVLIVVGELI
ncbi:MAG TPA: tetratricopeptide repeat protein [Thermoanaerobaculia bacterium]|nr:tetratricopeptide repeat protein [Thermoanaerobaculia bacterium]